MQDPWHELIWSNRKNFGGISDLLLITINSRLLLKNAISYRGDLLQTSEAIITSYRFTTINDCARLAQLTIAVYWQVSKGNREH